MNDLNPHSSEIVELNEQLRLLSLRFIKAQNELAAWKLNFDIKVVPDARTTKLTVFKDGNTAGGIKEIEFDTILQYADDFDPLVSEIADQFVELLLVNQIRAEVEKSIRSVYPNIVRIDASR